MYTLDQPHIHNVLYDLVSLTPKFIGLTIPLNILTSIMPTTLGIM